jgi:hypothetical protein
MLDTIKHCLRDAASMLAAAPKSLALEYTGEERGPIGSEKSFTGSFRTAKVEQAIRTGKLECVLRFVFPEANGAMCIPNYCDSSCS